MSVIVDHHSLSDHIRTYNGALSPLHCQSLIERFESSSKQEVCCQEDSYNFVQIDVTEKWPDEYQTLTPIFLSHFNKYQHELDARFWPPKFAFEHLRMKRYLPNGVDGFPPHVDVMCQTAARRFMTAIIYLNEVTGGETVFPTLGVRIAPEIGTLLAFPPLWLFPHAGLPTAATPKYILHTYMCYPS
jgi:prolyl 4-hydroxylase